MFKILLAFWKGPLKNRYFHSFFFLVNLVIEGYMNDLIYND